MGQERKISAGKSADTEKISAFPCTQRAQGSTTGISGFTN